jgi:diguanylate cyclase (GGDEF)-like protein
MLALWVNLHDRVSGIGYWTKNIWLQAISQVLILQATLPGYAFLTPLYFFLATLGSVLFLFGFMQLLGRPIPKTPYYIYVGCLTVASISLTLLKVPNIYNSILCSLSFVFISISYIYLLLRNRKAAPWFARTFAIINTLYVIFCLFHLTRAIRLIDFLPSLEPIRVLKLGSSCTSQLVSMILLSAVNYCILILIYNQLIHELALDTEEKADMLKKLRVLAENDGMTGIFNRSTIENKLELLLKKDEKSKRHLLLLIDVDAFKAINDQCGHDYGDRVLIGLAGIFDAFTKTLGFSGRWGGDEFLLIVQDCEQIPTKQFLDSLMETIRNYQWETIFKEEPHPAISISCGYAVFYGNEDKYHLLRKADENLYRAKSLGGNCFIGF